MDPSNVEKTVHSDDEKFEQDGVEDARHETVLADPDTELNERDRAMAVCDLWCANIG